MFLKPFSPGRRIRDEGEVSLTPASPKGRGSLWNMTKVTAIEIQKRSPNRVNVYLDGEFAFGLARIVAAWLKVGQDLDEKKIEQLQAEDARERALQQAILFLSYRVRSESEIRRNLRKHEI